MKGILVFFTVFSVGCAMSRHRDSGYFLDEGEVFLGQTNIAQEKEAHLKRQTASQLGISSAKPLDEFQQTKLAKRVQLKKLENKLRQGAEKNQYLYYRPFLFNDAEKIRFLSLPDMSSREQWAQMKGLAKRHEVFPEHVLMAVEQNDVVMGMSQPAVLQSWGEPASVEVAGNPRLKNEKWTYREEVASIDGFVAETRILYFEAGRVVGWEKK